VVPEMVRGGPPGERVCVPKVYWEAELAVMGVEPRVRTGRGAGIDCGWGATKVEGTPLMKMILGEEEGRE